MKHLKLFESYGYENISISRNDFYTFTDGRNPNHLTLVPFTRREIEEISGVLGKKKLDDRIYFNNLVGGVWRSPSPISDDITEIVFFVSNGGVVRQGNIFKLDDDWFLYQLDLLVMREDVEGIYTKCDQLEGLIEEINRTLE